MREQARARNVALLSLHTLGHHATSPLFLQPRLGRRPGGRHCHPHFMDQKTASPRQEDPCRPRPRILIYFPAPSLACLPLTKGAAAASCGSRCSAWSLQARLCLCGRRGKRGLVPARPVRWSPASPSSSQEEQGAAEPGERVGLRAAALTRPEVCLRLEGGSSEPLHADLCECVTAVPAARLPLCRARIPQHGQLQAGRPGSATRL